METIPAPPGALRITEAFTRHFGKPALLVRGPGRVNLIGEHTDYNLGFVLPGAVDRAVWLALRPRNDLRFRFRSVDLDQTFETGGGGFQRSRTHWANYLMGVLSEMGKDGRAPGGVDCAFGGDVPIGSGMSSSAALECGFAFGLNELFGLGYDRVALALLGQRAENRFVGVGCGIMDQFASVLGEPGHLIRLDCRDLSFERVPFERTDLRVVLCDTRIRRTLAGGEYNVRRAQCEAGVAVLAARHPEVKSLRDATPEMLAASSGAMEPVVARRCGYVVAENLRVLAACEALAQGRFEAFGEFMNASHAGLSRDYDVSCRELDILAQGAQAIPGVLGSRMMGAGFGGCTISLVEETALPDFRERMGGVFREGLGKEPVFHVCSLTGGTGAQAV